MNLREDNKVSESKMAVSESNMAEFKMAAIIKLSENEWVKFILCKMVESKMVRIQDGCHHQFKLRMNEFESDWISLSLSFVKSGWIQDGRIQDGCHHQVESEWMSLSQIELVWVRVLCRMVESTMAEFKMTANHQVEFRMNEWSKIWMCKWWESMLASVSEFESKY